MKWFITEWSEFFAVFCDEDYDTPEGSALRVCLPDCRSGWIGLYKTPSEDEFMTYRRTGRGRYENTMVRFR